MDERAAILVRYPAKVVHPDPADAALALERLVGALPVDVVDLRDLDAPPELDRVAAVRAALVLDVPDWLIPSCPLLDLIQTISTGIETLDTAPIRDAGIRLANAAGTGAPEIAEFVLARILEHWKRLPELAARQAKATWQACYGRSLVGVRVVLVGYGPINREVARRLVPFGVRLTVVRRSWRRPVAGVDEVYPLERLGEAMATADVVVSALPEVPTTTGIFDEAVFRSAPRGVFFCNVGRGSAVVEPDLFAALEDGHVGGAALDVFAVEPLPDEDPLWRSLARVSPHCSVVPSVAFERVLDLFIDNVQRLLAGREILNEIESLHAGS